MFENRTEVAKLLAKKLSHYKGQHALVLAIPRGGVPMGKIIADELGAELDVILVHKLGHPGNPEYAIGAVDEQGHVYADPSKLSEIDENLISQEVQSQLAVLANRRKLYTPVRARISPKGRTVIIIDDGIATGWTLKAAIGILKKEHPAKIVVAVGVAPSHSIHELREIVDEVICLNEPRYFQAIGEFFIDFSQVTDEDVVQILSNH